MSREHDQTIRTLNTFLRDEIAAVEMYCEALKRVQSSASTDELRRCLVSHERRVETLRQKVIELGGRPVETSGAWAPFARLFEAAASASGTTPEADAISALEQREDDGLKLYLEDVSKLDRETRGVIEREVLPEQVRTHDSLADLRLSLRPD